MNADLLERARAAYRAGDFVAACQLFTACKEPSETAGEVDHLLGNSLMKIGHVQEAADAYALALADTSYGKQGALLTNRGKALVAAGDLAGAERCFTDALQDTSYATPYKAELGLAQLLLDQERYAEAGTAFRKAAIDGANPAPASALAKLGACFIKLGRPGDAIEAYRTALDFAGPRDDARSISAGLGEAYALANRPTDAIESFRQATADGLYKLTDEQADAMTRAQDAIDAAQAQRAMQPAGTQADGAMDARIDPLDPLGKSGTLMPDPSDTGFFKLTEDEMIREDKRQMKIRRKHRHTGLKVFLVLLFLLIVAAAGLAFGYTRGLGFPSQQDALTGLFEAVSNDEDPDAYLASGLSEAARAVIVSSVPEGATATITNMDQSMTESVALVTVELPQGGSPQYDVSFVRSDNHIGWVVSAVAFHYELAPEDEGSATDASDDGVDGSATDTVEGAESAEGAEDASAVEGATEAPAE